MKLVRFGPMGQEQPGLIDEQGSLRDLSAVLPDIGPTQLGDAVLDRLRRLNWSRLPKVAGAPRLGCPVAQVGKFIAIGLNYADHAAEAKLPVPTEPVVFMKATSCLQGPNDPVMLPKGSQKTDWEVELGVVIGAPARHVPLKDALRHVAGYCVATMSANAPSSWSAAAPGTRAKGATPLDRWAPGWSPATKSAVRRN